LIAPAEPGGVHACSSS